MAGDEWRGGAHERSAVAERGTEEHVSRSSTWARTVANTVVIAGLAATGLVALVVAPAAAAAPASEQRAEARRLSAEVADLDRRIDDAVQRYAQAAQALDAVRGEIADTRAALSAARDQVQVARAMLTERARLMYKQPTLSPIDVMFHAERFEEFVAQVKLMERLGAGGGDIVAALQESEEVLRTRSASLVADMATAERLVDERAAELRRVRGALAERRALLRAAEAEVRQLATQDAASSADAGVAPPTDDGGQGGGRWWPSIQSAAAANGVSARGMYRLMMCESGGSPTIVGPGGYYGLFQYAPGTWRGSWNPYRGRSITDGEAQIKATAVALRKGYGPMFWTTSYAWAFGT